MNRGTRKASGMMKLIKRVIKEAKSQENTRKPKTGTGMSR